MPCETFIVLRLMKVSGEFHIFTRMFSALLSCLYSKEFVMKVLPLGMIVCSKGGPWYCFIIMVLPEMELPMSRMEIILFWCFERGVLFIFVEK